MDGLRAVPDNIPNAAMVAQHLQRPLTAIPDPFGTADSYGHHMNQRLRAFLDGLGFEYTFVSATECYRSGRFNAMLLRLLERHDAVRDVVLPSLGPERRETYSPILPVCPQTGRVLQVPLLATDPAAGTITYRNEAGKWSSSRSPMARPSCSGAPTGRCAGQRSASTTRCTART